MKKKLTIAGLLTLMLVTSSEAIGPRPWGKSGTVTNVNAQVTVGGTSPFLPYSFCIQNQSSTVDFFVNWDTGVAATTDNAKNIKVVAGTTLCITTFNQSVSGSFVIGLITASSTAAYNISAVAYR